MTTESEFMEAQILYEEAERAMRQAKERRDAALSALPDGTKQVGPFRIIFQKRLKLNDDYTKLNMDNALRIQKVKADLKKWEDAAITEAYEAGCGLTITEYPVVKRQQSKE